MRILFVADGRSPTALNWIEYFVAEGHEVHLVSTFPCEPVSELASFQVVTVALSSAAKKQVLGDERKMRRGVLHRLSTTGLRTRLRQWFGPLTLPIAGKQLAETVERVQPDMIHAMRIPYEGMLAASIKSKTPLLISVWGNDFTLHARATRVMGRLTRRALKRATALHTDTQRDVRLAHQWGLAENKPNIVLPGGGGVHPEIFYPPTKGAKPVRPTIINPRGFRAYVNNETFFKAIPHVLEVHRDALFVCPTMQGEIQAERWVKELGIEAAVELLPPQSKSQMADLFRYAKIAVSPATHDGTPNTLLEAMACGCFPIAGDLESLREWITPGENGLLIDPNDPEELANAILYVMENPELRGNARQQNIELIARRATYQNVMKQAEGFYQQIVGQTL